MVLKAICDRCNEEIENYDAEKHTLDIVTGGITYDYHYDLCPVCLEAATFPLDDFIKGA